MRQQTLQVVVNEYQSAVEEKVTETIRDIVADIEKETPGFTISDQTACSLLILCTTFARQVEDLLAMEAQAQNAAAIFSVP